MTVSPSLTLSLRKDQRLANSMVAVARNKNLKFSTLHRIELSLRYLLLSTQVTSIVVQIRWCRYFQ